MACECGDAAGNTGNPQPTYTPPTRVSQVPTSRPLSFLTPVANKVFDVLNWATSPGVQDVNHGVSGDLDMWWNFVWSVSPPGLESDVGIGPNMRDPFAKLDRAMGGNVSASGSYRTGRQVAGVSQLGLIFTPEGAASDTEIIAGSAGRWATETGGGRGVLDVSGTADDAQAFFARVAEQAQRSVSPANYPGRMVELPGGGRVGLRLVSKSGPPTIDINVQGLIWREFKFVL
jgi:hypothetical protein